MDRFRNNDNAALRIPAESHLSGAFSVLFPDFRQNRVGEDSVVPFRERSPGLRLYAVFLHQSQSVFLLEERMKLYLIDCRDNLYSFTQIR